MGWWAMKSETGEPMARTGDGLVHYLGDAPWNIIDDAIRLVGHVFADRQWPDESEARELFAGETDKHRRADVDLESAARLDRIVAQMWADLDGCYQEDWGRSILPDEHSALLDYAVSHFLTPTTLNEERLIELDSLPREKALSYLQMVRDDVESGCPYRIVDAGRSIDLTAVGAFDRWALDRFRGIAPGPSNPEVR